ncbi:MAG: winged helix-turn-helix transcriptional regulator [Silicimonas sp.]|nr:winged helix-turn-helix transcriptional regulator [Silicimonas sp.]
MDTQNGPGNAGPSSLPVFTSDTCDAELDEMMKNAERASNFLKAISHEGRLMILCHLASGEKSVTELEELLSARQAAVSQQLSRLRLEGLVKPRREGKTIYYSLCDERSTRIIEVVYDLFCKPTDVG